MRHLEEGEIHAWLDGAVDSEAAARIEAHAAACAPCAAEVATARGLVAGASRILLALDGVPGGVIPAARQPVRRQSPWFARPLTRIAAGLVVAFGIGALATRDRNSVQDRATVTFETEAAKIPVSAPQTPVVEEGTADPADASAPRRIEKIAEAPGAPAPAPSPLRQAIAPAALPPAKTVVGGAGGGLVGVAGGTEVAAGARDSTSQARRADEGLRRSEIVATRAAPEALEARVTMADFATSGTAAGGACLVLDVSPLTDNSVTPLLPRRMRIRLAESPSAAVEVAPTRSLSSANAQGAAVGMRRAASPPSVSAAPAADAFGGSAAEPSAALQWQGIAGDSVVARLVTPTELVVFRLRIIGDEVKGTAGTQASPAKVAMVSGRRVACGGGL